jgi:DnaJ-domain-containing protein 1
MKWTGKVLGLLLGLATRRWQLMLLGVFVGHLFDIGWFGRTASAERPSAPPPSSDDPYRELQVDPAASDSAIEAAYRRLIALYHPDRVAGAAPEIIALAETRARAINQAYERIQKIRRG